MGLSIPDHIASAAIVAGAALYGLHTADQRLGVSRDLQQIRRDRQFRHRFTARIAQLGSKAGLYHMLEQCDPDKEGLWFEGRSYLYRDIVKESTRLACLLQTHGVEKGSVVALFMTNSPEMIFAIFAVSQLGAVPALINSSLRADTLAHVVDIARAQLAVTTPDLTPYLCSVYSHRPVLSLTLGAFPAADTADSDEAQRDLRIDELVLQQHVGRPDPVRVTVTDNGALMYTSGTTGKPKAVALKNFIYAIVSTQAPEESWQAPERGGQIRVFNCLPLFHANGLCGAVVSSLSTSGCCCLARKFSATNFSLQLYESRATRMMYIGEICRFMLAAPPSKYDRSHACRIAWGNGMQKDVWLRFTERFGIPYVREFYRSTEGQAKYENFLNARGGEGCVAFRGMLGNWLEDDTFLVKQDVDTGDIARDPKTGFCIKAGPDEVGEAIGRVRSMALFNEYLHNKPATEAKLIRNVFAQGDLFQRTGDLLVRQSDGWIRFQDRTGDTYRWMGENVSAGEVRSHIVSIPAVQDAMVYGTKLRGYDGKVGSVAVVLPTRDAASERAFLDSLPPMLEKRGVAKYAVPRLVRFTQAIPTSATFKHTRLGLDSSEWNPSLLSQDARVYWLRDGRYELLDGASWSLIEHGKARL